MKKIKFFICCLVLSFCFFAEAGTFTKIDLPKQDLQKANLEDATFFSYTGEIVNEDEDKFKQIIDKYKNIYVIIDSNGGLFLTGIKLGSLTAIHNVHIIVDKAYSASGFWAYGDKSRIFLDEKESELGLHLPYNEIDENPGDSMVLGATLYLYLHDICELDNALSFISELGDVRKQYGTHGMIVFTKKEKKIVH